MAIRSKIAWVPISLLAALWQSSAFALDIGPLLDTCPQHDPTYSQIRSDFQIRHNDIVVQNIPCTEPISLMPDSMYTDELIVLQTLRAALYMDAGTTKLPWAPGMRLYDWMKSMGGGINIVDGAPAPTLSGPFDGKYFMTWPSQDATQRAFDRTWAGIAGDIGTMAHEFRHLSPEAPSHVSCQPGLVCAPLDTVCGAIAVGCDDKYEEPNLGAYGVQYWLNYQWLNGGIYTGYSCLPQAEADFDTSLLWSSVYYGGDKFVTLDPPYSTAKPAIPGGACRTNPAKVDLFILVDLSGSFWDDLTAFKSEAPAVINELTASLDAQVGLGKLEDYPIAPFGDPALGDHAYTRILDLTADRDAVLNEIANLDPPLSGAGGDAPQSQLSALYQIATGTGEDLTGIGYPGASIPRDQNAHFRDGVTKIVLLWTDAGFHRPGDAGPPGVGYPGPTFDETVDALFKLDPARVIGISSGPGAVSDLQLMATATGAVAPVGGVDCDADGVVDISEGGPLVCTASSSGIGVADAIVNLVAGAVDAAVPIASCQNVTVTTANGSCNANASVDAGSLDPDGSPVTLYQSPAGPYPVGVNPVTLTVTDPSALYANCVATVTVLDTTAPVFTQAPAAVTLTSCSATPNLGAPTATDGCGGSVTLTNDAPTAFRAGLTVVTWTARDAAGNTATAKQTVTVPLQDDPNCCPVGSHIIVGTSNNDVLTGTTGVDCIIAKGGQDTIYGMGGDDVISAGDGDDKIYGGDGNDVIFAGAGQDLVDGGNGSDTLYGDDGDDRLNGVAGDDVLYGGQGQDILTGGAGTDQCIGGTGTNTWFSCETMQ